jgi:hypothetical protein
VTVVATDAGRVKVTSGEFFAVTVLEGIVVEVPHWSLLMVVHATKIYVNTPNFNFCNYFKNLN